MKKFRSLFGNDSAVKRDVKNRIMYYKERLQEFYKEEILSIDVSNLSLILDHEDIEYAKDPDPGLFEKVRCVEIYKFLTSNFNRLFETIMKKRKITLWDFYSAPGMDVLYSMLVPHIIKDVNLQITAISTTKDEKEDKR